MKWEKMKQFLRDVQNISNNFAVYYIGFVHNGFTSVEEVINFIEETYEIDDELGFHLKTKNGITYVILED